MRHYLVTIFLVLSMISLQVPVSAAETAPDSAQLGETAAEVPADEGTDIESAEADGDPETDPEEAGAGRDPSGAGAFGNRSGGHRGRYP